MSKKRTKDKTLDKMDISDCGMCGDKQNDITIVIDGREFSANRSVLAACSSYFKAMFTTNLRESTASKVILYDLEQETFELIVLYANTARLSINNDNVQSLLAAATFLQISKIQNSCCNYLKTHLDPSNCLGIENIAEKYSYNELVMFVKSYILRKFEDVAENEEFLLLDVEPLTDIIKNDKLNVSTEIKVYEAIMKWVSNQMTKSDKRRRHKHLCSLLKHIRFSQMKTKYLEQILGDRLIRSCQTCNTYVEEGLNFLNGPYEDRRNMIGARFEPRLYYNSLCLFTEPNNVFKYNNKSNRWTWLGWGPISFNSCDCLIVLDNIIYFIATEAELRIERFYPEKTSTKLNLMKRPPTTDRFRVGAVSHEGSLYVIGGKLGQSFVSHTSDLVEKYSPRLDKWTKCSPLRTGRVLAGITVLDHFIYVVGGHSGSGDFLNTVECYDSDLDRWHFVAPMKEKRSGCGCASLKGFIYVIGGCGTYSRDYTPQTGERYDPRKNIWEPIATPPGKLRIPSLAVVNGLILAISAYSDNRCIYAFDPTRET